MLFQMIRDASNKAVAIYTYLTTHLASARAAKIDNLDAAISSRAAASSALSNATWTNALAAILGNTIQTSVIASIQTGYTTVPNTGAGEDGKYADVAISAVAAINKCLVIVHSGVPSDMTYSFGFTGRLTSTTNLRVSGSGNAYATRWTVVEFK